MSLGSASVEFVLAGAGAANNNDVMCNQAYAGDANAAQAVKDLKKLSVNNNIPPADDCCRETNKSFIALNQLLISDKQLPKAVEPKVCRLDDPASVLGRTAALPFLLGDPGNVTSRPDLLVSGFSAVSLIRTEKSLPVGSRNNDSIQNCRGLADIMRFAPVTIINSGTPCPPTKR
jgi:hypothetical protein